MTRTRTYLLALLAAGTAVLSACSEGSQDGAAAARSTASKAESTEVVASPSGLPVGLLEGRVTRTSGVVDISNVRILVRADGTGAVGFGGGHDGGGGALISRLTWSAPGCGSIRCRLVRQRRATAE